MDRRSFLKAAALATGTLVAAPRRSWSQRPAAASAPARLTLGVPLTHSDWMLKPGIEWGPGGVRHMLDACKASGWSHVYWRVTDGGRAMYPSKVMRPGDRWDDDAFWSPKTDADRALVRRFGMAVSDEKRTALLKKFEQMDYSRFDAFGEAVRYGQQIGLRVHAWVTINEDDHGWGLVSDFARQHPECRWVKRDGTPYHSQTSFAFPQVQDYKLSILKELLDTYDLDGLFLDWIRTGDVRDNPQTDGAGVADSGYERPNVDAFKSEFHQDPHDVPNADPRWVALRARPQTAFMRRARDLVRARAKRPLPISVLVGHPWHYRGLGDKIDGNLRGLLLDVPTWSREGLIDAAVAAGYYRDGGNMEKAYHALKAEVGNASVDVWTYGWVPTTVAQFESDARVTESVGAGHLLLWEADYIDDRPNKAELQQAMRSRSAASA